MIRAACYLRVSTEQQVQEGDSLAAQKDALLKYIEKHEDYVLAGIYTDDGVSGTRADRDELNRLLDDVKAGLVDTILVTKLDRLFRSMRHYLNMMDVLDRCGVGWTAIWEPMYNTTTPQGKLIINQMMSIAQFEAENTSQRIHQVFEYKKTQKEVLSGNVSPGFRVENKHLVHSDLAPAVKEIFEFYARTGKLYETVRHMPKGLPQTKQGLKWMLKRKVYIGELYGDPNYCEPIVDKETFSKVQRLLAMNIKKNQKHEYLFSGLVKCAECGFVMASNTQMRERKYPVSVYRCSKHYQRGVKMCPNKKSINQRTLEAYLLENLEPLVNDAKIVAKKKSEPVKDLTKQRKAVEAKLSRLTDIYLDGDISRIDYLKRKEDLMEDLHALEMPPQAPESQISGFEPIEAINIYPQLTFAEKRQFWRSIIKEIRYGLDKNIEVFFL